MTERAWYDVVDKSGWDRGPWDDEPDKVQWIDAATGLDCLAVRGPMSCWCGYVGVPPGHRFYGVDYETPDVDVHGGLTFADRCMEDTLEGEGVCHIPEPGRPADVWWLGFDCGHFMDLVPRMNATLRDIGHERLPAPPGFEDVYRDLDYVRAETVRLAAQLIDNGEGG